MRLLNASAIAFLFASLLSGCHNPPSLTPESARNAGRFSGIGVFDAGKLWSQMTDGRTAADPASAKLADDEHIIVVIDNRTGEVRQCGDHSGDCVTMNPWAAGGTVPGLPVKLQKHAADFVEEAITPARAKMDDMENSSDASGGR